MLSEALRLIRVFHDVKQNELAERFGISKSYLSEIESGKKSASMELIEKYTYEFGIPASSILFFSEQIGDRVSTTAHLNGAQGVIAKKVLNFLQFIESRTETNAEKT